LIIKVMKKYKKFNCDSINQTLFNNNIYYDKCNNYLNSSTGLYYNITSVSVKDYDLRDVIQYSVINEMPCDSTITTYKNNIVLLRIESDNC
jgi:hypothetical protein